MRRRALAGLVLSAALVRTADGHLRLDNLRDDPTLLVTNAVLLQNYAPATTITGIAPAWTLAVEVAFNLALPLLALPAITFADRRGHSDRRRLLVSMLYRRPSSRSGSC